MKTSKCPSATQNSELQRREHTQLLREFWDKFITGRRGYEAPEDEINRVAYGRMSGVPPSICERRCKILGIFTKGIEDTFCRLRFAFHHHNDLHNSHRKMSEGLTHSNTQVFRNAQPVRLETLNEIIANNVVYINVIKGDALDMKRWRLSRYTVIFRSEAGDVFFHNSFMGALAVIPASKFVQIEGFLAQTIDETHLENETLQELCANGFFFPTDIEEQGFVTEVLAKEINTNNFDLIILPHENCNFRCTYCYETHSRGRMEPDVIDGLKRLVEKKTLECKSLTIRWFGGEPLLATDIIYDLSDSFLGSCEKNGIPYFSNITTNAYLLTPDVVDELLKRKVTAFQITLDGPAATHDHTRVLAGGGKTFDTIYKHLLDMNKRSDDFTVSLRVNFNNESLEVMDEFFESISKTLGMIAGLDLFSAYREIWRSKRRQH